MTVECKDIISINSLGLHGHVPTLTAPEALSSTFSPADSLEDLERENGQLWGIVAILQKDLADHGKRLKALEQRSHAPPMVRGDKTSARIKTLKEILKVRGSTTFKEIGRLLDLSPSEVNRLLSQADKRSFEIFARERDKREKVIRLKAQIRSHEM